MMVIKRAAPSSAYTHYYPNPEVLNWGVSLFNPGEPGPRFSSWGELEANMPRTWPTPYRWRLMGLGAMPLFQLGYTAPTFNNQYAPYAPGFNVIMPGLSRTPFGG
jgi:hypothetical protein